MTAHASPHHRLVNHRTYALVALALFVLAGASFALSFVHLGAMTVPVAMAISLAKALLVAIFFMELIAQRFVNRFAVIGALTMILLLVGLMLADVATRSVPPLLPPG